MRSVIAFIVALACAGAARARAQEPLRLTAAEAVALGLDASHRLAEARARGEAAEAVAGQRRAAGLPQVAAQAGYMRTNHVDTFGILLPNDQLRVIYPDIPDNYRARLDLQWPIYTGGRVNALERAARAEAAASAGDLAAARADLRLEITRAYWALVTATESLRVLDESVKQVQAHLADVRNRFDAGLVPPNDVSSVEAQESRERLLRIQAQTTREVVEDELARLVGAPPGTSIDAISPLEPPAPVTTPVPALIEQARGARGERAALVSRAAAASDRTAAAAGGSRPTVAVGGGVDYARPNPRIFPRALQWNSSWDASVSVSWPIFDGGRSRAERAEASASARAAGERLAQFDESLALEVRQRRAELGSSRAAIEAADDAVRAATEARRVVGDRFDAGVATSTDVLDAQVALLQAELDRTQALAAARIAEARLARALGR
ncbi:MAG: TolC family protein [Betaproteobacteria bacterium]